MFLLASAAALAASPDWMRYSRNMVQDAQGNVYVVGTVTRDVVPVTPGAFQTKFNEGTCGYTYISSHQPPVAAPCSHGFAAKVSADGSKILYATYLEGTASEWAYPIGVDASGNLFVYGSTSSPDFPVTGALPFASSDSFQYLILALSSDGSRILFSDTVQATYFSISQIVLTPNRTLLLAGTADGATFPTSPEAYLHSRPNVSLDGYVLEWDPVTNTVLASTLIGGSDQDHVTSVALGAAGEIYVAGYTISKDFPLSPAAFYSPGTPSNGVVVNDFVAKLDRALSTLQFSTIFGGSYHPIPYAVAADASGYVYVVGSGSRDMPVSPGAFETSFSGAFLGKFDQNGARVYLTYLGNGLVGSPGTLAPVSDGSVWVAGINNYGGVVTTPDALEPTISNPYSMPGYVKRISADGSRQIYGTYVSDFLAATGPGVVLVSEPTNVFRTINLNTIAPPAAPPAIAAIVNAASMGQPGFIAPGEIVSIFGSSIGPDVPSSYRLDAARRISSNLDGLEVLVDGLAAPVLYASKTQINVVVPFALTPITNSASVVVEIQRNGRGTATATAEGVYSLPGIFESEGAGLILNQDGTLNAKDNVAKSGSIISLFATGLGPMSPVPPDGSFAGTRGSKPDLRLQVFVGTSVLGPFTPVAADSVTYAGDAPGQVEGVVQIDFRLPDGAVFNTVYVKSGSAVSNPVTFWEADRT